MLTENTINEEQELIEQLQRRWMIGSDEPLSLDALPQSWRPIIETQAVERHSIMTLALASQHQCVLFQPEPPGDLIHHTPLPDLQQPLIPQRLRPLFRRIIKNVNKQAALKPGILLELLLRRGYIAHPADWLPSAADEELPDIYLPWCQWAATEIGTHNSHDSESLNADNWDDWYPAQRISQLKALRFKDSAMARILVETCAHKEPADKRLRVIQTLAINLCEDDVTYLQELLKDRSQKIVTLAAQYLARLGKGIRTKTDSKESNNAKELAQGYELKKTGIIKKRVQVSPLKLKSKKQQAIRSEQLENTLLSDFADTLGINVTQLAASWQFSENRPHDNQAFVANSVNTLAEDGIERLIENILNYIATDDAELHLLHMLTPRLSESRRSSLMGEIVKKHSINFSFRDYLSFSHTPLIELHWNTLKSTRPWKSLEKEIKKDLEENGYIDSHAIARELSALGMFLPQEAAAQTLNAIFDLGVLRADPITDHLKFNADLSPHH